MHLGVSGGSWVAEILDIPAGRLKGRRVQRGRFGGAGVAHALSPDVRSGLRASAHCMPAALRHPWLRLPASPARGHGQHLALPTGAPQDCVAGSDASHQQPEGCQAKMAGRHVSREAWGRGCPCPLAGRSLRPPGLRSLHAGCASPSMASLAGKPGSRARATPRDLKEGRRSSKHDRWTAWREATRSTSNRRVAKKKRHDAVFFVTQSRNPESSSLRAGACSLRTALASICRIRSRVTLKMWPTSSSV
jgi:hypothetical protein